MTQTPPGTMKLLNIEIPIVVLILEMKNSNALSKTLSSNESIEMLLFIYKFLPEIRLLPEANYNQYDFRVERTEHLFSDSFLQPACIYIYL
jgi:hypothetical protein